MSVIVNGTSIKKISVNSANMKERYANDVKVFASEQILVANKALETGVTFTIKKTVDNSYGTSGAKMSVKAYSGAKFGLNVSMLNVDIRGFDNIVYNYTRMGVTGQAGYFPAWCVCGSENQIKGISYTRFYTVNINNCTKIVESWNENKTFSGTFVIPDNIKNADEPQYLAFFIGAYNNAEARIELNNISLT